MYNKYLLCVIKFIECDIHIFKCGIHGNNMLCDNHLF